MDIQPQVNLVTIPEWGRNLVPPVSASRAYKLYSRYWRQNNWTVQKINKRIILIPADTKDPRINGNKKGRRYLDEH
jgi:hypothetical protein